MATAVALPTYEDAKGWQDKPPTYEERKDLVDAVAAVLSKPEDRTAFKDKSKVSAPPLSRLAKTLQISRKSSGFSATSHIPISANLARTRRNGEVSRR